MSDEEKLQKFLNLLPESSMRIFFNVLSTGMIHDKYLEILDLYDDYIKNITSKFSNPAINEAFCDFNRSLRKVEDFSEKHFSPRKNGLLGISPEELGKLQNKLNKLVNDTESKYNKFLESAIKIIYGSGEKQKFKEDILKFEDGILYFHGKTFNMSNKSIQMDLLNALFEDTKTHKIWHNDELWDHFGEEYDKKKRLKFYQAADRINKMIAVDTGVKDFLQPTTKQVSINPNYLT